jgi:glutamate-1-semialdehyde 2,1-aminomutase
VITGFRVGPGGVQQRTGITPDLTCLGKIVGGGLPVGVYGGRREIMELAAPLGPVYQAGTLAGNPVAMAAGIAALERLRRDDVYARLDAVSGRLAEGLAGAARRAAVTVSVVRDASLLTVFFAPSAPRDFAAAASADTARFARFFQAMLSRGVLLPPSQFEAWFVSAAHTEADVDQTVRAAQEAFAEAA